jgi:GH3 auxin-responsive promoter
MSSSSSSFQSVLRVWLRHSSADRFDDSTWKPREAQEEKLLEIVRRNEGSVFGVEHGFDRIRSIEDYQERVPPTDYDGLSPYVERALRAEKNVLTADDPLMFATTSGTTGSAKYIPVTPSYLHEYSHGVHVHLYRLFTDFRDILGGKMLVPSSSDEEGRSEGGLAFGAISGYLTRTQPKPIRRFYALPYELAKVKDVEAKYYLTLRHALPADIRAVMMPNPSSLLMLAEKMTTYPDQLIADIRSGTVSEQYVPKGTPRRLLQVEADPKRADELASILRMSGSLTPAEVWPNLRVLCCWKGGTMPLYLNKVPAAYGDVPVRDLGYMASEGRGSIPLVNSGAGGALSITSHFYEFVPEEERDSPNPTFLTADQLESNREYFIYFTSSAGLYRYDINDVVRVVDFYRNTPVVQFIRKGQGMTSITGEKLTESQVAGALVQVVGADGHDIQHFTACVEWGEPPRYAFFAEVGEDVTTEALRHFATEMDRALSAHNIEYEAKRESQRLGPPVVKRVAPGTYQLLRQRRVAEGAPEAQVKIPQLSPNMQFGDDLEVREEVIADG